MSTIAILAGKSIVGAGNRGERLIGAQRPQLFSNFKCDAVSYRFNKLICVFLVSVTVR